jgi:hypothetical protein
MARVDWPIDQFVAQEDEVEKLLWTSISDLEKDVAVNPNKYIASMHDSIAVLRAGEESS